MVMMIRDLEKLEEGKELGIAEGKEIGREEGKILGFVEACRDDGKDDTTIITRLMAKYGLKENDAKAYVLPAVAAI